METHTTANTYINIGFLSCLTSIFFYNYYLVICDSWYVFEYKGVIGRSQLKALLCAITMVTEVD